MQLKSSSDLILIGLGANMASRFGGPRETLERAVQRLEAEGLVVTRRSSYWRTRPVPISDQPWFVNAIVAVETDLPPPALLSMLHRLEALFGRIRTVANAPRVLDLDLLAYGRVVRTAPEPPLLPHPRMAERAFVLLPLREVAEDWVHPATGDSLAQMIDRLPADQEAVRDS